MKCTMAWFFLREDKKLGDVIITIHKLDVFIFNCCETCFLTYWVFVWLISTKKNKVEFFQHSLFGERLRVFEKRVFRSQRPFAGLVDKKRNNIPIFLTYGYMHLVFSNLENSVLLTSVCMYIYRH